MRKIFTAVVFSFFTMLSGLNAQNQLNTVPPLNGGNGNAGITFNISADRGVIIDTIYCTFTGTGTTDLWYNTSPINGQPTINAANGWSRLATGFTINTGVAAGSIVAIPVDLGLIMTPGDTFGFYIEGGASGVPLAYTTYNTTNTSTFTDGFITIETGPNVGYGGGLPSPGFSTRQFNGGVKYTPLGGFNDAAVLSVDSPLVFCAGTHDVVATIGNFGINQIDSVDINWEVNGVAQPTFSFVGTLDTLTGVGRSDTTLNIGSASFTAGVNTIKIYTSNPNGGTDTTNYNDTLLINVGTSLSPTIIDRFNPTTTSIDINVNNVSNQLDYEVGLRGFTRGTGTSGSSTTFPFTISGLTAGTEYDIYVRNNCGGGDTSLWISRPFITAFGMPYFQDFQAFTVGIFQNPWPEGFSSNTTDPPPGFNLLRWESESANGFNTNTANTGPIFDHTLFGSTGGRYVYLEAGFTFTGTDSANLYTPYIEIPATESVIAVSYWYFAFGSEIDRLEVHADTNGVRNNIATYFGQQQTSQADEWIQEVVYLRGYEGSSMRLNFTGFATRSLADIAIDDIRVDTVPDLNASLQEIIEPTGALCPGTINPVVALRNRGVTDLTSVDVVSDINGVLDTNSFTFAALQTGDSLHLSLSPVTFSSGVSYDLSFYVINPNGGVDEDATDDTLSLNGLNTGLVGAITIDPSLAASATNYTSFNAFSNDVNSVGVCGAVTVTVAAGTYTGNIRLIDVPGTSPTDRLIIDGVSTDSVTLRRGTNSANATVLFEGTSYVTIKNMTIENTSGAGMQFGVHFSQNSTRDSILDCRIVMSSFATFNSTGVGASSLITGGFNEGNNANYITVMGCDIEGGNYSIHFEGANGNWNVGNSFINNTMTNMWNNGFYFDDQDSLTIKGNSISGDRNANLNGIYSFDCMNFDISANDMVIGNWGVYISNANSGKNPDREALMINNMITSLGTNGRCIYMTNPLRINMYHNSIRNISGNNPAVEFIGFAFIDSLDVRNNIFTSQDGIAFEMNGAADTSAFLRFDNNLFWNQNTGDLIRMGADNYTSLSGYQTARPGFNINGLEGNPSFISDSNLHIVGVLVNDAGDNGVNVLVDIDGDPRPSPNATFVDPGADEYDPPACPAPIDFAVNVEGPDSITVSWRSGFPGSVVEYNWTLAGRALGTGDLDSSTVDTIGIGSLTANTGYDVYIREICRRGDTSLWVGPIEISTPCAPYTARYTMNFDNQTVGEPADCWSTFKTYNQPNAYARVESPFGAAGSFSSPNSLVMYSWFQYNALTDTLAAISPQFTDMVSSNTEISFYTNSTSTNNKLYVMTTDRQDATGTFTMIDTIDYTAQDVWVQHFVEFTAANGYNGTDEYVVLAHSLGQTFSSVRIDNFTYDTIPSCRAPRANVASDIFANEASFGWDNPSGATSWEIEIDTLGFTGGTGFDTVVTSNPATIGNLLSDTQYEFRVRAICGVGDTSLWTPMAQFKTACDAFTQGYFVNFDSMIVNETPNCWFGYKTSASVNAYVQVRNGFVANNGFSSPNALVMYSWNQTPLNDSMYAITPQFSDMSAGDKQISFQLNVSDTNNVLYVSTADKQGANATFTPIDTFDLGAPNTWQEEVVYLDSANGYNGTDEYVVFSHSLGSTFSYLRLDDIKYDTIPSCPKPNKLTANLIGPDSANLSWQNPSGSTSWEIQLGEVGFILDSTQLYDTTATSNPFMIKGLVPVTRYEYVVRSICGAGDTSLWSNRSEFVTECVPYTANYSRNFDTDFTFLPPACWEEYQSYNQPNAYAQVRAGFNANDRLSAPNALVMYSWFNFNAASDTLAAISPEFSDMSAGDKRIRFFANTSNLNNDLFIMTSDGQTANANYSVIDTINFTALNVWNEYIVDLTTANGYNGTDSYVVLAHSLGQTFSFVRVDDFRYEEIPTCFRPSSLGYSIPLSSDTVILNWTDPQAATEWEIRYGTPGFDVDTEADSSIITTSNPDTLGGLLAGSSYDWYIRSICAVGDTSYWVKGFFRTKCDDIFVPYFTGFENDIIDSVPICWTGFTNVAAVQARNAVSGPGFVGQPRTGSRSLVLYSWNGVPGDRMTQFLPKAGDITSGDKQVRFWLNSSNINSSLIVGTASGSGSLSVINGLDTLSPTGNNVYQEFEVDITTANGYNGTDEYIVLAHDFGSTFTYLRIDDFTYEDIPSCIRPKNLAGTSMPTADSASISWTEANTATEWEIRYGAPGFDPDTAASIFSTTNPDTLTGLTSGTRYQFYVRSICTPGDSSRWSLGTFETDCVPVTAPYFNGFENDDIDSIPVCWNGFNNFNQPFATFTVEGPGFVGSPRTGNRSLVLYSWNGVAANRVSSITPEFSDMPNGDKRLRFWMNSSSIASGLRVGTSSSNQPNAAFNGIDTVFATTANNWERFTVELTTAKGYNGTDEYVVLEHSMGQTFTYVRIDDFEYETFLSCIAPANVSSNNIGYDSTDLSWSVLDTATQFEVEYGTRGFTRGNGTSLLVNTDTFTTISGLMAATYYDVYVRSICGPADTSRWSSKHTFLTACDLRPTVLPFYETWDTGLNGNLVGNGVINCDTVAGSSHSWTFQTNGAQGRVRYGTNAFSKANGTVGAVTMDIASGFALTKNELILSLNLEAYANSNTVDLSFYMRDHTDENHAGDRIWVRGSVADPWVEVFNINTFATSIFTKYTVDVDAALFAAGQNFTSTFQINFGQEDDGSTPNDGVSFDSIEVSGNLPVGIINSGLNENSINIYPNPSRGVFNLNITTVDRQNFNMIVRNVKGQVIYTNNVAVDGTYRNQVDLTGWSKGVYYLQIQSEAGTTVEKLIVQ